MAPLNSIALRSFGKGEIAPSLQARADLPLYQEAVRTCRNFIVQKHGGARYREGTQFVAAVKAGRPCLLKYVYNGGQTYVLEVGAGYLRFIKNGALVMDGSDPFEIATPFLANLDLVRITQDLHIATLTHQDYPPHELIWGGGDDTTWVFQPVTTTPSIAAPANIIATRGAAGDLGPVYVVTARKVDTYEESLASAPALISESAEPTTAAPNILTWDAVAGAAEFRVYKDPYGNGVFGYLGAAEGLEKFYDAGFVPDFAVTPPKARVLFANAGEYPHTAAYYQQRRVFSNSHLSVSTTWASQTGFPSNFSIRSPLQDDDAITFTLAGPRVKGIQHLIALNRLIMFTDGAEWIALGDESNGVLTPFDIHTQEKGWSGSAARPVPSVIGSTVLFTQYLSRVVRDLVFNEHFTGFQSRDLTIFAGHLFKTGVARQDVQVVPDSVLWCVRSDGVLLGLTYLPELEQYGWHRHDTAGGLFLDVCVIPEGSTPQTLQDYVYVLVEREGLGTYIERFAPRFQIEADDAEDVVLADSAVSYSGSATTSVGGLAHLEGETVYAWTKTASANVVQGPFTVVGGAVTLTTAATKAHVGLPITGQLETLAMDRGADLRSRRKKITHLVVVVERSVPGFLTGPDEDHLFAVKRESWQSSTALSNDQFDVPITGGFSDEGRVLIQHAKPSPLTVLAILPQFEVGG